MPGKPCEWLVEAIESTLFHADVRSRKIFAFQKATVESPEGHLSLAYSPTSRMDAHSIKTFIVLISSNVKVPNIHSHLEGRKFLSA
ncbi:MAG TPA: hypothetical protein DD706_16985 [Nitrospiraceae bacterium]|nr:hypothetical protein [Nitrospiraceae bacterium]